MQDRVRQAVVGANAVLRLDLLDGLAQVIETHCAVVEADDHATQHRVDAGPVDALDQRQDTFNLLRQLVELDAMRPPDLDVGTTVSDPDTSCGPARPEVPDDLQRK